MPTAIEDVPMWLPLQGRGHAVELRQHGWYLTACGIFTPNGPPSPERPRRICSKCRQRLATAPLISEERCG
jgi:hypothetical protein